MKVSVWKSSVETSSSDSSVVERAKEVVFADFETWETGMQLIRTGKYFGTIGENKDAKYVKSGGYLYYSTCSIFERENDQTVAAFLKTYPDYEIAEISSPLAHEKKKFGLQFLPDTAYGAGFYVAKLVRKF